MKKNVFSQSQSPEMVIIIVIVGTNQRVVTPVICVGQVRVLNIEIPLLPGLRHTQFKAHLWQKSQPKEFRFKAHFFRVKIFLSKND